jgi:BirA family biotin operon repressor/biotin-[acetyl-CoA-carboxylase] ligase
MSYWASKTPPPEFSLVSTDYQTAGRGQYGSLWADPGGNISMSLIVYPENLRAEHQFLLHMWSALALAEGLVSAGLPSESVSIKWPNDILVNSHKIAGILLQSTISGAFIRQSILGIGINVSATPFGLSEVTSLFQEGIHTRAGHLREQLLGHLFRSYQEMTFDRGLSVYQKMYYRRLWKYQQTVRFYENNHLQTGVITGITPLGHLCIDTDQGPREFTTKSIRFLRE